MGRKEAADTSLELKGKSGYGRLGRIGQRFRSYSAPSYKKFDLPADRVVAAEVFIDPLRTEAVLEEDCITLVMFVRKSSVVQLLAYEHIGGGLNVVWLVSP